MMRYASKNTFLIEEQRLQQELSTMIVTFLDAASLSRSETDVMRRDK